MEIFFSEENNVEIIKSDITEVPCDAIVSPANSFGFMDGGLDLALSERFGWHVQSKLQEIIKQRPLKELLIGEAVLIETNDSLTPWIIAAPTMRVPMRLRQSINAYLAMKAILVCLLSKSQTHSIKTVAIPGLGTGVGSLSFKTSAMQMFQAYSEIILEKFKYPEDFGEAQKKHIQLNPKEINIWDKE